MIWTIKEYNDWIKIKKPIKNNIFELNISNSNIKLLENLKNLTNLKILYCDRNKLKSLKGIVKLNKLEELYCFDKKLKNAND
jgi:Leucine-rich repeat (LRR) protein